MNYKMPCVVESVKLYFRIGFSWKEMILLLGHCIIVCVSTHCDDKYKDVDGCWWSGGQKEKKTHKLERVGRIWTDEWTDETILMFTHLCNKKDVCCIIRNDKMAH